MDVSSLVPERIQVMGGGGGYEWSGTRTYPGHGGWMDMMQARVQGGGPRGPGPPPRN